MCVLLSLGRRTRDASQDRTERGERERIHYSLHTQSRIYERHYFIHEPLITDIFLKIEGEEEEGQFEGSILALCNI